MIPGVVPNPWVILAAVGIWLGSIVGAYFYGTHHAGLVYKAEIAKQDASASALLAQLTATAAAKDAANAEFARQIDEDHAHEIQTVNAAHADFDRALALKLRNTPSRACSPGPGTAQAADPGRGEVVDAPGIFISKQAAQDLGDAATESDTTVAVMKACKAFADSVGR